MQKYTFNKILKTLEKLEKIDTALTPLEKNLLMDFREAVVKKKKEVKMGKYTLNQILKTLEKLFEGGYTTTQQIKKIKWDNLQKINKNFTPIEKSLVMDFRDAVSKKKIVEFLAGKDIEDEEVQKNDGIL